MNALTKAKNLMNNLLHTRKIVVNTTPDDLKSAYMRGVQSGFSEGYRNGLIYGEEINKQAYAVGYAKGKTDGINEAKAPVIKPNFIKELEDSNKPTLKKKLDEALKLWTEDKPAPKKRGRPRKVKGE